MRRVEGTEKKRNREAIAMDGKGNDAKCKNAKWWEPSNHFVASEDKG